MQRASYGSNGLPSAPFGGALNPIFQFTQKWRSPSATDVLFICLEILSAPVL